MLLWSALLLAGLLTLLSSWHGAAIGTDIAAVFDRQ